MIAYETEISTEGSPLLTENTALPYLQGATAAPQEISTEGSPLSTENAARPKCKCRCVCSKRPERLIACSKGCGRGIGPGCCWDTEADCCRLCAKKEPEPEPEPGEKKAVEAARRPFEELGKAESGKGRLSKAEDEDDPALWMELPPGGMNRYGCERPNFAKGRVLKKQSQPIREQ